MFLGDYLWQGISVWRDYIMLLPLLLLAVDARVGSFDMGVG
jgi:hypothetical protein